MGAPLYRRHDAAGQAKYQDVKQLARIPTSADS